MKETLQKLFNTIRHQGNVNQYYSEILPQITTIVKILKRLRIQTLLRRGYNWTFVSYIADAYCGTNTLEKGYTVSYKFNITIIWPNNPTPSI